MSDAPGPAPLLEARGLGRRTREGEWLLRRQSLRLFAGERVALAGPSGSGKSLLLRALALLDEIDEGQVLWQGKPIANAEVPGYRRQVIYLHQRPALREGNVRDNLQQPFRLRLHRDANYDADAVNEMLRKVGRDAEFLERPAATLSGGEAQLVALVRAIQLQPRVLLLDEPTAGLDAETVLAVESLVAGWLEECRGERAVVWVTHAAEQVERVADRVVQMHERPVLQTGASGP